MRFQPLLESAPGEFLGRSAEEAVERARAALGADAKVRCWKTRRGGVMGFFAREVYVAGVREPEGSLGAVRRAEESSEGLRGDGDAAPLATFDELVASTTDEVSYSSNDAAVQDRAFRDVLAQAEAALNDVVFDDQEWQSDELRGGEGINDALATSDTLGSDLEAFRASLASFGLPAALCPADHESVFDGLIRSLATLATPPALPSLPGSIIAVVGSRRDAWLVARDVAITLDLDESDVVVSSDDPTVRRRIARRKHSSRVTVVALEAPVRGRSFDEARDALERMRPDYVLGAVAATLKGADVDRWRRELGVNALALRRWDETETPAELVTALPIYSVDGVVMSTMRWLSLLLSTFVDRTDAGA